MCDIFKSISGQVTRLFVLHITAAIVTSINSKGWSPRLAGKTQISRSRVLIDKMCLEIHTTAKWHGEYALISEMRLIARKYGATFSDKCR